MYPSTRRWTGLMTDGFLFGFHFVSATRNIAMARATTIAIMPREKTDYG